MYGELGETTTATMTGIMMQTAGTATMHNYMKTVVPMAVQAGHATRASLMVKHVPRQAVRQQNAALAFVRGMESVASLSVIMMETAQRINGLATRIVLEEMFGEDFMITIA